MRLGSVQLDEQLEIEEPEPVEGAEFFVEVTCERATGLRHLLHHPQFVNRHFAQRRRVPFMVVILAQSCTPRRTPVPPRPQ